MAVPTCYSIESVSTENWSPTLVNEKIGGDQILQVSSSNYIFLFSPKVS